MSKFHLLDNREIELNSEHIVTADPSPDGRFTTVHLVTGKNIEILESLEDIEAGKEAKPRYRDATPPKSLLGQSDMLRDREAADHAEGVAQGLELDRQWAEHEERDAEQREAADLPPKPLPPMDPLRTLPESPEVTERRKLDTAEAVKTAAKAKDREDKRIKAIESGKDPNAPAPPASSKPAAAQQPEVKK